MNHEELKQNRYQHTQSLIQQSFENPNTEPRGEKDNADNSDKAVIYDPEEDEIDPVMKQLLPKVHNTTKLIGICNQINQIQVGNG